MYRSISFLLILLLCINGPIGCLCTTLPLSTELYVVPFPSLIDNNGDGSLAHPYSSLQQALNSIEHDYHQDISSMYRSMNNVWLEVEHLE